MITRKGKEFTARELVEIGRVLAQMSRLRAILFQTLNGRVSVRLMDKLMHPWGRAHRFYDELRSKLEDDWFAAMGNPRHPDPRNPFYSENFHDTAERYHGEPINRSNVARIRADLTRTVEEQIEEEARQAAEAEEPPPVH